MASPFRYVRHLARYRRIVSVLARHGFGSLLEGVRLDQRLGIPRRLFRQQPEVHVAPSEHLRLALEELGPTFVKMGQILSTRPDLLPPEYIAELSKLQDTVPPAPWEEIRAVLHAELGRYPEEIFETFDPTPMAAASLAQVHAARLKDGRSVVVKV
ncbi:AarF/ABC1/UbiB kinase family protein, partial [Candidatus Parcubacteria bacterium]